MLGEQALHRQAPMPRLRAISELNGQEMEEAITARFRRLDANTMKSGDVLPSSQPDAATGVAITTTPGRPIRSRFGKAERRVDD
jgi:hypothetical protein